MRKHLRLPNTFVLLFAILAMIALASWFVPGGQYDTHMVNGRALVDPATFHYIASKPQGPVALMMAPIIGFVLIVGGAFSVLQKTETVDSMIRSVARAHTRSPAVRAALIPVFITLFSLGGATFGMAEEAIPFILIFVPLALALGYDSVVGVSIPFVGSQVGFGAAFLNPFNVGHYRRRAGAGADSLADLGALDGAAAAALPGAAGPARPDELVVNQER